MDASQTLERGFWNRLLGRPATRAPRDGGCWACREGRVEVELGRAPELPRPGGAIRLEGKGLPVRVLAFRDDQGEVRAFRNRCRHMGRRLDPVPGAGTVRCCSVGKATYAAVDGAVLRGPARGPLEPLAVEVAGERLRIALPTPS